MSFNLTLFSLLVVIFEMAQLRAISQINQLLFYQTTIPDLRLSSPILSILSYDGIRFPEETVEQCYDSFLNGASVDIFKPNITAFQLVLAYYKSLPNKRMTLKTIERLIFSARSIAQHVYACIKVPKKYRLGFTSLSDMSKQEFRLLLNRARSSNRAIKSLDELSKRIATSCYPPRSFRAPLQVDWAALGAVTGVRHQGYQCGSCWVFVTIAALESAHLRAYNRRYDLSEQQLVDCAKSDGDGCGSGTSYTALRYIYSNGVANETNYPYRGVYKGCPEHRPEPSARMKHFCIRGQNWYGPSSATSFEQLTDDEIARAVAFFGPVSVCLNGLLLQNYKGGIFDDVNCSTELTHMALIVGYSPHAWILKNSWGVHWGRKGYFQVARHKNMCGIQFEMAYPLV